MYPKHLNKHLAHRKRCVWGGEFGGEDKYVIEIFQANIEVLFKPNKIIQIYIRLFRKILKVHLYTQNSKHS